MNQEQFNQYKPTPYDIANLPQMPFDEVVEHKLRRQLPHQVFVDRYSDNQKRALLMLPMGRLAFGQPSSSKYPMPAQHFLSKDEMYLTDWPPYVDAVSFLHWQWIATSPAKKRTELGHQLVVFRELCGEMDRVATGRHPDYEIEDAWSVDEVVEEFLSDSHNKICIACLTIDAAVADRLIGINLETSKTLAMTSDQIRKKIMDYLCSKECSQAFTEAAEQAAKQWAKECEIESFADLDLYAHPQSARFFSLLDDYRARLIGIDFSDRVLNKLA